MANAITNGRLSKEGSETKFLNCCHILCGHEAPISCIAFCSDLDIKVSGSLDGVICVHSVPKGKLVRVIRFWDWHEENAQEEAKNRNGRPAVRGLALDKWGNFVSHFDDGMLQLFTINGSRLASAHAGEKLHAMEICSDQNMIVTGGENCNVVIRNLHDLAVQCVLDLSSHGQIRCLSLNPGTQSSSSQYIFVGTNDGKITIIYRDKSQGIEKESGEQEGGLPVWIEPEPPIDTIDEGGTWWNDRVYANRQK